MKQSYNCYIIVCKKHGYCPDEHKYGTRPNGKKYQAVIEPARFKQKNAIFFKYAGGLKIDHVEVHYPKQEFHVYPLPRKIKKIKLNGCYIFEDDEKVEEYRKELDKKTEETESDTDTEERKDNNEDGDSEDFDKIVKKMKTEIPEVNPVIRPKNKKSVLTYSKIFVKRKPRKCKKLPSEDDEKAKVHLALKDLYGRMENVEAESILDRSNLARVVITTHKFFDKFIFVEKNIEALERKVEMSNCPRYNYDMGDVISKVCTFIFPKN